MVSQFAVSVFSWGCGTDYVMCFGWWHRCSLVSRPSRAAVQKSVWFLVLHVRKIGNPITLLGFKIHHVT